ncbi:hypothetical protein G3545_08450 [Starkeya sp. ORNL1]|uniref:hypothetical protein n=1 Tax=Starkeya sp. ORNL1 TaxID=2709380 RepID=UPI0014638B17|nr:hypothetical protein [Starkeya sp. ORNL1]QJP13682.1 hypothetical protein G3545_08450 [Starkeya sp. ORNL1]
MERGSLDENQRNTELLEKIIMKLDEQNRIIMGGMKLLVWRIFAQALLFFSYTNYLHPQWMWSDILRYWPK